VAVRGDTASGEGVRGLVTEALERLGRIDVLVNNSGPWGAEPYAELTEELWDSVLNSNVKAAYLASQAVVPGMRAAGWGRIVNIAAGSMYLRNHSAYGLAKNAVGFLTEQLAVELGPAITVNAISPGQILESTPDIEEFDPTFVPRTIDATPLRRLVTRGEVADMVVLLCTPAFAIVTGATVPMDGGWRFYRF
jgi:NAD(P)-dependent dehydrogenase (short-subunit alcohol dehydrogenase family)